jgi:hypothetical protein
MKARMCGGAGVLLAVLAAGFFSLTAAHAAGFPEPDGYDKAKFGMTAAQVTKLYPKAKPEATSTPAPGQAMPPFTLVTYTLDDQSLGPLKPCTVGFRFFKDELYEIQFRCPRTDKQKITDYLQKRFGLATRVSDDAMSWTGKHTEISHVPAGGVFMFADLGRSRMMTFTLMNYLNKMQGGAVPNTSGAPPAGQAPPPAAH